MCNVDYETVANAVLGDIQQYAVLAVEDEKKLIDRILHDNDVFNAKNISRYEKNIRESKNRIREIDGLLQNLYEDKVAGEIAADIFKRMSAKYSVEQTLLITDVEQMEKELDECQRVQKDLSVWINRIKQCLTIDTLTREVVVELIERIDVAENDKELEISIRYRFGCSNYPQKEKELV